MKTLNKELINSSFPFPQDLHVPSKATLTQVACYENSLIIKPLPEKILQFGEGNFLRGFVDWMVEQMNAKGLFNGSIVVVKPIPIGNLDAFNIQDNLYTLYLRGIQNNTVIEDKSIISSISRTIDVYSQFDEYLKCAENPDLRFVVSNTTEAGITYNPADKLDYAPPSSFPAKLTTFLYHRYKSFAGDPSKGMVMIPCELIDRNGDNLKRIVFQLSDDWKLEDSFKSWLQHSNYFLNTLVDRIVTGYPRDEISKLEAYLGYQDKLINTAEIFHLWVIEADSKLMDNIPLPSSKGSVVDAVGFQGTFSEKVLRENKLFQKNVISLEQELPFTKAGLNVIWTNDMTPYRTRKVRILNGAHTMTVLAAYLFGKNTVKECTEDTLISKYLMKGIFEEIIPTLDLSIDELTQFAYAVIERFKNPFINHYLLSISLNSVSKFKTRVLPSILQYYNIKGQLPSVLSFSLAALIAFYKGSEIVDNALIGLRNDEEYKICDDLPILEFFKDAWEAFQNGESNINNLSLKILSNSEFWDEDLSLINGMTEKISGYLNTILEKGINEALEIIFN